MNETWKPNASIASLKARAKLLRQIRAFFEMRDVMEVETPVLSRSSGTDVQLAQWQTTNDHFLHTSPEFAMKRLLAAGSGDIYQIARVFRMDEVGQRHNPEFTMLEWYRIGWDEFDLMKEVVDLISVLTGDPQLEVNTLSYQQAFLAQALPDPHLAGLDQLRCVADEHLGCSSGNWSRDDCLDALMAMVVEPALPANQLTFIHDYPEQQASLARYRMVNDIQVGRRFELYWQGMELANGYCELTDVQEQRRRFESETEQRAANGDQLPVIDENFLAAMQHGLPDCAGVALGVDRLLMVLMDKKEIGEVVAFLQDRS